MKSLSLFAAFVFAGVLFSSTTAEARNHCRNSFSVGFSQAAPAYYYAPQPVYYQPAPIYVQPAPVYYQAEPVYYQPAPVYRGPAYIAVPTRQVVYERPCYYPRVGFSFNWRM